MRSILIATSFLAFAFIATATEPASDLELAAQAETFFHQGKDVGRDWTKAREAFAKSSAAYHELYRRGVRTPGLFHNLANAELLLDRWPMALWACRCGLGLDPGHEALRKQFDLLRQRVDAGSTSAGPLPATADWWIRLALAIACVAGFRAGWAGGRGRWIFAVGWLFLAVVWSAWSWYGEAPRPTRAIVVQARTPFLRGNGPSYPPNEKMPMLSAGLEVTVTHRRGGWIRAKLDDGELGWIAPGKAWVLE